MSEMLSCKTHVHMHLHYIPSERVKQHPQGKWTFQSRESDSKTQRGSFYPGSSSPTTGTPTPTISSIASSLGVKALLCPS